MIRKQFNEERMQRNKENPISFTRKNVFDVTKDYGVIGFDTPEKAFKSMKEIIPEKYQHFGMVNEYYCIGRLKYQWIWRSWIYAYCQGDKWV